MVFTSKFDKTFLPSPEGFVYIELRDKYFILKLLFDNWF